MNDSFQLVKGSQDRRRTTASPAERTIPTQQEIHELFLERITPETDLPPMQPLFKMFDVPCFYRGELVADCGKAKSGKTFFLSILMAACLTQKALALERNCLADSADSAEKKCLPALELRSLATEGTQKSAEKDLKPLRVLWIDTEQSQQSTQEILKHRIIPLAEKNYPTDRTDITEMNPPGIGGGAENFSDFSDICETNICEAEKSVRSVCDLNETLYAFNLRGLGFERRSKMVDVALRTIKPDLCIIDGIKDLMTDINDAVQATLIMERLMALAKELNCCIVCVLHLNKSEQDRNMRGSIGTELTNKAFEVFRCEMISESEVFKVTHAYSRKQKMKQKFYYRVNDDGLPEECSDYQEKPRDDLGRWVSKSAPPAATPEINLQHMFSKAMEGRPQRPFGEVMAIALKKCGVVDAKAYYHYLDQAIEQGIVRKAVHPDTGITWIEQVDNTLPF